MGMQIFEQSGTFRPADWGLKAGDIVQVIAVGGGGGGNGTIAWRSASSAPYWEFSQQNKGGDAGKSPGSNGGGGGAGYGGGGGGAAGQTDFNDSSHWVGNCNGGGAGQMKTAAYRLPSAAAISITVGQGGQGAQCETRDDFTGENGGSSSFGNIVTAQGGLGGGANNGGVSNKGFDISTQGSGGGGDGGYTLGGPLFGGRGGVGGRRNASASRGTWNGGDGGNAPKSLPVHNRGGMPGRDGGPGHGVVIVCW